MLPGLINKAPERGESPGRLVNQQHFRAPWPWWLWLSISLSDPGPRSTRGKHFRFRRGFYFFSRSRSIELSCPLERPQLNASSRKSRHYENISPAKAYRLLLSQRLCCPRVRLSFRLTSLEQVFLSGNYALCMQKSWRGDKNLHNSKP